MFGTLFKQIEQQILDHCKRNERNELFPTLYERNHKLKKRGRGTEEERKENQRSKADVKKWLLDVEREVEKKNIKAHTLVISCCSHWI